MGFKKLVEACWYGKSPSVLYPLAPFEWLFKTLAARRKSKELKKNHPHDIPVIVVGNIVVGGTGKTPVLIALAKYLLQQGINPGIISRGYGRKAENLHIVSPASTPALAGDEPIEIYQSTGCPVVVCADRNFALKVLQQSGDVDVVLSDDGLQHYKLSRQLEIAIFNQFHGLGNGHCLPLGPLREPASRLDSINFILINKSSKEHPSLKAIREHFHADFDVTPLKWVNVHTGEEKPLAELVSELNKKGAKKICALAGLGQPEKFFHSLEAMTLKFDKKKKKDHAEYTKKDFSSNKYGAYLMTAKDAVKCKGIAPINSWYLQVEAQLSEEFKSEFLYDVKALLSKQEP